jgi:hypothetical protein
VYGDGAYGEAAFGESPGGAFPVIVGVSGSMGAIEAPDILLASGTVPPPVSVGPSATADIFVIVVELELGRL